MIAKLAKIQLFGKTKKPLLHSVLICSFCNFKIQYE